ncbi:hypothetical protein [Nocardioides sp. SYSU DS0663]|uniref:hypothetical protein n=1 Tax=Nocardioides sp. SYSU DS0663 TaxID=3416445 RepID=UPI003F4B1ED3
MDAGVVAWTVLWLVIGGWTGFTIWQLAELGDTVTASGEAIGSAGQALQSLDDVPVVGDRPAELGRETVTTADSIRERGQVVKGQLRQLAILLGLAIALIPTTPIVGLYGPLRLSRRREDRSSVPTPRQPGDEPRSGA